MSRAKQMFTGPIVPQPTTVNRDGYPAYERSLEEQYLQTLLTNTLGNTYYAARDELLSEAGQMHDAMLAKDPEFAAKALVHARNEGYMRLQPTYGLAKLSKVSPELFAKVFDRVILIPSDLLDFLTILDGTGRGQGGRAVKRQVGRFLNRLTEYWAIKYGGAGRGYTLADAVRTAHPRPKDAKQEDIFRYLIGEPRKTVLVQIAAFEWLKIAGTEAERLAAIERGRLPHEVVTAVVPNMTPALWRAVLHQMPVFALMRHLNALDRAGVLDEERKYVTEKFSDATALQKAKILPFRFLAAMDQVCKPWVRDMLRGAAETCLANVPPISGRTAVFLDQSGSMGQYIRTAAVAAFALWKKSDGDGVMFGFNTQLYNLLPSKYDSILSQAERVGYGGGTDTSLPFSWLMRGEPVDNVVLITDEQQNQGAPFMQRLAEYRRRVSPKVRVFILCVAPYRSFLVPESDPYTWYVYGWSDQVLKYISLITQGWSGQVEAVRKIAL